MHIHLGHNSSIQAVFAGSARRLLLFVEKMPFGVQMYFQIEMIMISSSYWGDNYEVISETVSCLQTKPLSSCISLGPISAAGD